MRMRLSVALLVAFAIGCPFGSQVPTTPLPGLEIARLDDSLRQLVEQKSTDAVAFEKIAEDALAVVSNHSDPANRVALYRIASVAAWQAGDLGASTVTIATEQGKQTCDALPGGDANQPRDCAMIRTSYAFAVHEDLARERRVYEQKLDALGGHDADAHLPATDGPALAQLFGGFESQLISVNQTRVGLTSPPLQPELLVRVDHQRKIMFCSLMKTWSLGLDVEGATALSHNPLTERKQVRKAELESTTGRVDCRALVQTPSAAAP